MSKGSALILSIVVGVVGVLIGAFWVGLSTRDQIISSKEEAEKWETIAEVRQNEVLALRESLHLSRENDYLRLKKKELDILSENLEKLNKSHPMLYQAIIEDAN